MVNSKLTLNYLPIQHIYFTTSMVKENKAKWYNKKSNGEILNTFLLAHLTYLSEVELKWQIKVQFYFILYCYVVN